MLVTLGRFLDANEGQILRMRLEAGVQHLRHRVARRMMRGVLVAACIALTGCTTWAAPAEFPEFDYVDAKPLVVIADVRPGDVLPEFEQCKPREGVVVICLHDPMWLKVSVRETLYGKAPAPRFVVSTTSHYGFLTYEGTTAPRLMLLMIGPHGDVTMPTYADYPVLRRDDGAWYLVADIENPAWFLPCSIAGLQEAIDPQRFPASLAMDPVEDKYSIETNTALFHSIGGKVYPRNGIPVTRIAEALQREHPAATAMECEWTKAPEQDT